MASITILRADKNRAQTKVFTRDKVKKTIRVTPYSKSVWFYASQEPVADVHQLEQVLQKLRPERDKFIIRGAPRDAIAHTRMKRTKYSATTKSGSIMDIAQQWVMLDIDKFPLDLTPFKKEDFKQKNFDWDSLADSLVNQLPRQFQDATYIYQISSSQNVKTGDYVSMHLWFWLDEETSNDELKTFFSNFNAAFKDQHGIDKFVDLALFNAVQVHYTADPIFINMSDPITVPRVKKVVRVRDDVLISDTFVKEDPKQQSRFLVRLGELGGADGYNTVLHTAAWSFVAEFGDSAEARQQFIDAARQQIIATPIGTRSQDEIDRYKSHDYLQKVLQSAVDKGAGRNAVSGEAIQFMERFYYLADHAEFYDLYTHRSISEKAFDALAQAQLKTKGLVSVFLQQMEGRVVNGEVYYPDINQEPLKPFIYKGNVAYLNSWTGRDCGFAEEGEYLQDINNHLLYLCDNDKEAAEQLGQWLAHTIRYPGDKIAWAPLLISDFNGVGKTVLSEMYRSIGDGLIKVFDGAAIGGTQFNDYAYGHEIAFIDEVEQVYRTKSAGEALKSLIGTDTDIQLNEKGIRRRTVPNRVNYILTSNKRDAVKLDNEARRFLVLLCTKRPHPDEYYYHLAGILTDGEKVMAWAESIDLTNFNRHARPKRTEAQKAMEAASKDAWIIVLDNAYEGNTYPMHRPVIALHDLLHVLRFEFNITLTRPQLTKYLQDLGWRDIDQVPYDGKRVRMWLTPKHNWSKVPRQAIADMYQPIEPRSQYDLLKGTDNDD